jgi:hypothetical protein
VRRSLGRLRPGLAAGCIIRVEGTDAYVKDGHEAEDGEGGKHLLDLEGASLARSRELTSVAGKGKVRGVNHMTIYHVNKPSPSTSLDPTTSPNTQKYHAEQTELSI